MFLECLLCGAKYEYPRQSPCCPHCGLDGAGGQGRGQSLLLGPQRPDSPRPKTLASEWDARFLRIADEASTWPSDFGASGGVAAVLVSPDRRRMSIGYSGGPRDYPRALTPDMKDDLCIHAEENAVANAGCDLTGWTIYTTKPPCLHCAVLLHQHRVARVVTRAERGSFRWAESQDKARKFLEEVGIWVALRG